MTDVEWAECDDPQRMLPALPPTAAVARLRRFAAACAERVVGLTADARSRRAMDAARGAGGSDAAEAAAVEACTAACPDAGGTAAARAGYAAAAAAAVAVKAQGGGCPYCAASHAAYYAAWAAREAGRDAEPAAQARLLRDLFGDPRRPAPLHPGWLAWNDGCVGKMARAIRDEGAFHMMPVLADALEEAGCEDRAILDHCRAAGEHIRGCWVLDLLLGLDGDSLPQPKGEARRSRTTL
jgi:hypothetical protein